MRPMFVLIEKKSDNSVTMSKDEFERIINEAYEGGIHDAHQKNWSPFTKPGQRSGFNEVTCTSAD